MKRLARNLFVPYLALAIAGLGYLNWWLATSSVDISPIAPAGPSGSTAPSAQGLRLISEAHVQPLSELRETVMRPVFRPDRRPPGVMQAASEAPAAPEMAPNQSPADNLKLVGMMRSGTSAQRALIRVAGLPDAAWVEVGAEIGGWTVGRIETDRVLIERNGDKAELKLFTPRLSAPDSTGTPKP